MSTSRSSVTRSRTTADLSALDPFLDPPRIFERDEVLPSAPAGAFRLESGWAGMVKKGPCGIQILGLYLPGDLVGFDLATTPLVGGQVIALTSVRLRVASFSRRSRLVDHPDLVRLIAAHNLGHHQRLQSSLYRLGAMSGLQRTAHLLLELYERVGSGGGQSIDFPLRQEVIARTLGLSLVHINRVLLSLRSAKIAIVDRGRLQISDLAGLRALVETGASIAHYRASSQANGEPELISLRRSEVSAQTQPLDAVLLQ